MVHYVHNPLGITDDKTLDQSTDVLVTIESMTDRVASKNTLTEDTSNVRFNTCIGTYSIISVSNAKIVFLKLKIDLMKLFLNITNVANTTDISLANVFIDFCEHLCCCGIAVLELYCNKYSIKNVRSIK